MHQRHHLSNLPFCFRTILPSSAKMQALLILCLSSHWLTAFANVEKVIFLAPQEMAIPQAHPSLEDLYLVTLSPSLSGVRLPLNASFPTKPSPTGDHDPVGEQSWLLLDHLLPGRRYEVRICWLATVRMTRLAFGFIAFVGCKLTLLATGVIPAPCFHSSRSPRCSRARH